jgi:hypothetical protein
MSMIVSAEVSRRFENVREAAGQALSHSPPVAEEIAEDLQPFLEEGEVMPDFVLFQTLISRALAQVSRELDDADHQRKHFKNIDNFHKEALDKAAVKLRRALADVRYILDRTLSKKQATAVFESRNNLTRLKSPVIERVGARLLSLLSDPKLGWDQVEDEGYRATAEAAKVRLQRVLADFEQAKTERLPERDKLVLAKGQFDRDLEEKKVRLQRRLRILRGLYEGAGFLREAAALALRRRAAPKPPEEPPKAAEGPRQQLEAELPGSSVAGVPSLSAEAVPAEAEPAAAEPRRGRHASRRGAQTAQQGVSPEGAAAEPAGEDLSIAPPSA